MRGRRRLLAGLFGLAIVAVLIVLRLWDPYPVRAVRSLGFDVYQQLAPRQSGPLPVRIIDIDERSLAEIGQWPWPRDRLAQLTDRLTELGAVVVVYDMLFPEPDRASPQRIAESVRGRGALGLTFDDILALPDFDQEFADALARAPSVLAFSASAAAETLPERPKVGVAISGSDPTGAIVRMPGATMPLDVLAEAARGIGAINLSPADSSDVVRRIPMALSNGDTLFPSLSVEAMRVALGAGVLIVNGEAPADGGDGFMSGYDFGPDFSIPTTKDGLFWLYFRPYDPAEIIPAWALLGDDYQGVAPGIAGHFVFVGTSAEGLLDIKATPLGEDVPGVFAHVQAIEQILTQTFLYRDDAALLVEFVAFAVIALVLIVVILNSGPLASFAVGAAFTVAAVGVAWWQFRSFGILVDLTFPLGGGFVVYASTLFFQLAITDADKRQIRRAFGHYVAPALLSQIEKSDEIALGGEERDLSIMFIDVRNFTTISEGMTPHELVTMLNRMFEVLGAEITKSQGTIDKFIGDAIMAFWNAPLDIERHALRACEAALKARAAMDRINAADGFGLRSGGHALGELRIGIGIATGQALVGNMGLKTRFDYSCVGDVVNVASRVEGACKAVSYDIAVVEETCNAASELAFLYAGSLALKGKAEREPVFIVVGDAQMAQSAGFKSLAEAHERLVAALGTGKPHDAALDECLAIGGNIDDRLREFYTALPERAEDFVNDQRQQLVA